ncbi:hypothetical protein IWX90DRAFT_500204, partial [Phyllosticta citrichinensis]
ASSNSEVSILSCNTLDETVRSIYTTKFGQSYSRAGISCRRANDIGYRLNTWLPGGKPQEIRSFSQPKALPRENRPRLLACRKGDESTACLICLAVGTSCSVQAQWVSCFQCHARADDSGHALHRVQTRCGFLCNPHQIVAVTMMIDYACSLVEGLDASEPGLRWSLMSHAKIKALAAKEQDALMQKLGRFASRLYSHFAETSANPVCSQNGTVDAADGGVLQDDENQNAESESSRFLHAWLAGHPLADITKNRKSDEEDSEQRKKAKFDKTVTSNLSAECVVDESYNDDDDDADSMLSEIGDYILACGIEPEGRPGPKERQNSVVGPEDPPQVHGEDGK